MATEALFISVVPNMRFSPGQLILTVGVHELIQQGRLNPSMYLRRHLGGDWGDLVEGDRQLNDAALASGQDRLFSSYQVESALQLWIITEWDRSVTTLLLPSEY
ncbi:hypothetical protein [Nitrosomonas eutropha]|uniref:Uncharacterized protein n=2 Tax=Nitrosomonas eutropha TaxID=916 RepID=A0ABX5MCV6_9PROT|nr:hypothetical protein [Nitrosomonas eutropha]ABI58393.1 conserved hypothetical protein [Nitrosomonas eutropha C91]PXV84217.1 hypothetical protein C8R14_10199 [Nitrosomonas eutropha]